MDSLLSSSTLICLRLYLIRHGETEANRQGLVVGNAESPLTPLGIDQAKELGRTSSWLRNQNHFHRIFSSDLERAKRTTTLVLSELQTAAVTATTCSTSTLSSGGTGSGTDTEAFDNLLQSVEYTPELRELAKGPRQGFPKSYSIDEAIEKRQQLSITEPFPLLETDDDGWDRISHWFGRQIRIAIDQTRADCSTTNHHHTFHLLVFGHAGIFRIFLTRLIGQQVLMAHPSAKLDSYGRLSVPNTSLTILDIYLDASPLLDDDVDDIVTPENRIRTIDIILLTSTEHIPVLTK